MKKSPKTGLVVLLLTVSLATLTNSLIHALVWDWEDGTLQGWKAKDNFTAVGDTASPGNTTSLAYNGSHSLQWHINGYTSDTYWYVYVPNPQVDPGELITYYAWVPSAVAINGLKTFMRDRDGNESRPSIEVSALLTQPGHPPIVRVKSVNSNTIGKYEKFEIVLDLLEATFSNPYDPDEIDVQAAFTAPSGKQWQIYGFYDNYQNANAWKVRFMPNEVGLWRFYVTATDVDGTGQSSEHEFTVVATGQRGWICVSSENPHYLAYDDSSAYYGVGAYSPWGTTIGSLNRLHANGGNMFAIWNIMYGGFISSYGIIEEELGRYNQEKCGRIDQLLELSEARELKCMLCIWPHDLFSNTVWAHQWHRNPYRHLCDVKDIYRDATAWDYQKKQYRYLIARFGHSRSLGFWEIINEINGTDGWQYGRQAEALTWVQKVDAYFNTHDPYTRPTTASLSGGKSEYLPALYESCDMPNLHIYELQGWNPHYPGNLLRSSMKNYADAALRFWNNFNKPAIFGETGYSSTYYEPGTKEYTDIYHNALWASLTNGLAMTPIWWELNDKLSDKELKEMANFARFVAEIDFIQKSLTHFEVTTDNFDLYGMKGDSTAFCWIRDVYARSVSEKMFAIDNVLDPAYEIYAIKYFNTWTGQFVATHIRPCVNGKLVDMIPRLSTAYPDIAMYLEPAPGGDTPAQLALMTFTTRLLNKKSNSSRITCYLLDNQDRFCGKADNIITFSLVGPGTLVGPTQIAAQNGIASIEFQAEKTVGIARIIATTPGLVPDTLVIEVTDRQIIDDFEDYYADVSIRATWTVKQGTKADIYLENTHTGAGRHAMRLEYGIGNGYKSYARIEKELTDYSGAQYFCFWYKPDNSNRSVSLRIRDKDKNYLDFDFTLTGTTAKNMHIPLEDFTLKPGCDSVNLAQLIDLTITIEAGTGSNGTGTIYFDSFEFRSSEATEIRSFQDNLIPLQYRLEQNYPNPFNHATTIEYSLPRRGQVKIAVYNTWGQRVATLVDTSYEAGRYYARWNPVNVASGVYYYKIESGNYVSMKKCVLLR